MNFLIRGGFLEFGVLLVWLILCLPGWNLAIRLFCVFVCFGVLVCLICCGMFGVVWDGILVDLIVWVCFLFRVGLEFGVLLVCFICVW